MTVVPEDVISTRDRISGWVLKGSEVLNAIACRRFGVLENDTFNSFRQQEDKQPSAIYPLHARCEVSGLEQRDILVRAKGKSTFVALVAGKYEKIDGVGIRGVFVCSLCVCAVSVFYNVAWESGTHCEECTSRVGI